MRSNYKPIGELVTRIDERNINGEATELIGVSIDKCFIKSVANTIGTDLTKYKIIRKDDFAVSLMQVSRDSKIPVARQTEYDIAMMSPAYPIFRVTDKNVILPEYLDMWFKRTEFDREAAFIAVGGVRGSMPWDEFAQMEVHVPDIDVQRKIVRDYQIIEDRIALKKKINDNLVDTADTIFSDIFLNKENEETVAFTDIVQLMGGGTPQTEINEYWGGEIPFFTPKDVSDSPFCIETEKSLSPEGLNNCSSRRYPSFTTFVTCRGTVGNLSMAGVPMAMNQSCYALKGKENYPPLFVYAFTRYIISTMKRKASGAVFSALVTRDFEMEKVFKPNVNDAIYYQELVQPLFDVILSNTTEIKTLESFKSIILASMSGH